MGGFCPHGVDIDSDGRMDVVSGSIAGNVHVFRRKSNGTYPAGETLKFASGKPVNCGRASIVTVADWDGDGDVDLLIGNEEGAVFLVTNSGTARKPSWAEPQRVFAGSQPVTADGGAAGPSVTDWDGDGKLDLLLGSASGRVSWYRNVGGKSKPELSAPVTLVEAAQRSTELKNSDKPARSGAYSKVCAVDWNGDGRKDLLVGDYAVTGDDSSRTAHGWVWVYLRETGSGSTVAGTE